LGVVIDGALTISGGATLNAGSGTTFYLPSTSTGSGFVNGSVNIAGGVTVDLVAPTSGAYNGILLYQDHSNPTTASIVGGAHCTMQGILYFPDAQLNMSNGTGMTMATPMIVKSISITGGSTFQETNYSGVNPNSPLTSPRLVE
jgi:hypothetical protein